MGRLTRDRMAKPVSRDQTLTRVRGQGNIHFPCSADHEKDWQPYPVDPYSAIICDDHTIVDHTHVRFRVVCVGLYCRNEENNLLKTLRIDALSALE